MNGMNRKNSGKRKIGEKRNEKKGEKYAGDDDKRIDKEERIRVRRRRKVNEDIEEREREREREREISLHIREEIQKE